MAIFTEYAQCSYAARQPLGPFLLHRQRFRLYVEHCNELLKLITKLCNANRCTNAFWPDGSNGHFQMWNFSSPKITQHEKDEKKLIPKFID